MVASKKLSPQIVFLLAIAVGFGFLVSELKPVIKRALSTPVAQPTEQKPDIWSVGLVRGAELSSLKLASPDPIFTSKDVTDVDAAYVADPFLFEHDGTYHAFVEILNYETKQGDIGYATSRDLETWSYQKIVLDEKFHLSYPYVFEWDGEIYMIPESHEDLSVRLYRARAFPNEWEYVTKLLSGYHYVDPSILRHDNMWWLFVTIPASDLLNVYYSKELEAGWTAHPQNPVVRDNIHLARPAGRIIEHDGTIIRFAQDDGPYYGIQVYAIRIDQLTTESYKESLLVEAPILGPSNRDDWTKRGMHHIDPIRLNGEWVALVDGRCR